MEQKPVSAWPAFLIGWILCFAIRLLPWRPPNMEPILATTMPFGKHLGSVAAFLFAFLSILLFDLLTTGIGSWTFIAGLTYGLVGIASAVWFRTHKAGAVRYALFSIPAVLFYDLVTGVLLGPALWGMSLRDAFFGQIPFTVNHLLSTIVLALVLSPLVDRWVVANPALRMGARMGA